MGHPLKRQDRKNLFIYLDIKLTPHDGKGQAKSKLFFQSNVSSIIRTKEFNFDTMRLVFVRFLEDNENTKKTFPN